MNLPADLSSCSMQTSVCGTGAHSKMSSVGTQAATRHSCKYRWLRAPDLNPQRLRRTDEVVAEIVQPEL
jgi:hypothetical protein